jgi:muconolactone D-isomerase
VDGTKARAAVRAGELATEDHLLRLWNPPVEPGAWRTPGLWNADDEGQLQGVLATMPPHMWMTVEVTPLVPHPSDPGASTSENLP